MYDFKIFILIDSMRAILLYFILYIY